MVIRASAVGACMVKVSAGVMLVMAHAVGAVAGLSIWVFVLPGTVDPSVLLLYSGVPAIGMVSVGITLATGPSVPGLPVLLAACAPDALIGPRPVLAPGRPEGLDDPQV